MENIGLQRVLEKNGFVLTGRIEEYIEINGKWIDSLIFVKMDNSN
ncbi:MAG: GNAT family N-acetyltransferase [Firmicutes bacterium]|nr:GNAT family N-acetyltransferase [Bacillota bacterium]